MAGSFLLWRGATMRQEWITPYLNNVGGSYVRIPGNTSCSRNPKVALGFALDEVKEDFIPVLFVIACQNYVAPSGILMNNEAYTAYPEEGEFLLQEGCAVHVLAVDSDVKIDNNYAGMEYYNSKTITVIHLFQRC